LVGAGCFLFVYARERKADVNQYEISGEHIWRKRQIYGSAYAAEIDIAVTERGVNAFNAENFSGNRQAHKSFTSVRKPGHVTVRGGGTTKPLILTARSIERDQVFSRGHRVICRRPGAIAAALQSAERPR
jgi:hypothetical protein